MHRTHTSTNQCMKKNCNTYQSIADLIDRLVHVGRLLGASDDGALETGDDLGLVGFLDLSKERKKQQMLRNRVNIYKKEIADRWQRCSRIPTSKELICQRLHVALQYLSASDPCCGAPDAMPHFSPLRRNAPSIFLSLSLHSPRVRPLTVSATLGTSTARTRCHETHTC